MEFIRTIREKQQTARQESIAKEAEDIISLSDFADSLYIAVRGVPIVPIESSWTSKEIVDQLSLLRQNYVNARIAQLKY